MSVVWHHRHLYCERVNVSCGPHDNCATNGATKPASVTQAARRSPIGNKAASVERPDQGVVCGCDAWSLACRMHRSRCVKFNEEISKSEKRVSGRTDVNDTPLEIHGHKKKLSRGLKEHARAQLEKALSHNATFVERAEMFFDDVNGPRGGVDTICRVTLVLGHLPNIFVEERAADPGEAVTRVASRLARALSKTVARHGLSAPKASRTGKSEKVAAAPEGKKARTATNGVNGVDSLIGRRVGMGKANLEDALQRPEKAKRNALVDTASPGVSASDRRAGGAHSARRNSKRSSAGMTAALEDSLGKPSRKSTRASANGVKAATPLTARAKAKAVTPKARHDHAR